MNFNLFGNSQRPDEDYSGIGIKLMGKIADELSYTRTSDGRNCLLMVKYYQHVGLVQPKHRTQAGYFKRAIDILNSFNWLQEQPTSQFELSSSNQPLQKITTRLNSDIKGVTQVLWWIERLENVQTIPEAVLQQCKLAVVEGFTNAVRHAHKNLPLETPIELAFSVFQERLEIEIWDSGQPFVEFKAKLKEELPEKNLFCWDELSFTFH